MYSEHQVRKLLQTLQALWQELDTAKLAHPTKSNPMPPAPGPRYPGGPATTLDLDLTARLREIVLDARNHVQPNRALPNDAPAMIWWLRFNLQAILELDFAADLVDELHSIYRELVGFLNPAQPQHVAGRCWNTAPAVLQVLRINGHLATRKDLYNWSQRGHIQSVKDGHGNRRYDVDQVLSYLAQRDGGTPNTTAV